MIDDIIEFLVELVELVYEIFANRGIKRKKKKKKKEEEKENVHKESDY
ncbi:MAG: hypothetical protein IJX66_12810 [Lachnospiraceae bacterium]|nr:hypothetical protein [Lachnospiraceae bacterium]